MFRASLFTAVAIVLIALIGFIFWKQELQYVGPTPIPEDYNLVNNGDEVDLAPFNLPADKPLFIHFYNNDCPCSRFNAKEFRNLVYQFKQDVNFISVIQSLEKDAASEFMEKYDLGIQVIQDTNGKIAEALGVYSTPQAVIVQNSKVFFKGNYNKARFCTTKNTKFAEMALKALINNEPAPIFPEFAYVAYGCELPANHSNEKSILNLFDL